MWRFHPGNLMATNTKKEDRPLKAKSPLIQIDGQDQENALFPYLDRAPNPALASQGWERRFMAGPDRLDETIQLYQDLGFEVHQEPIKPNEFNEICQDCQTLACDDYVTIYTRKKE
jgi:hypothetical protein